VARTGIPSLPPAERVKSCDEVVGTVRPQWAVAEARRCLLCHDAPCSAACPAGVDVPRFIRAIRTQSFRQALKAIREANFLAGVCARVCPVERQCEGACASSKLAEPIAVAALQRFVADEDRKRSSPPEAVPPIVAGPVAVVGAGPAGLACAAELARRGVGATVFDGSGKAGGLLTHGIPAFRLPRGVVVYEAKAVADLGVRFVLGRKVARVSELFDEGFRAVVLAVGLGREPRLSVPGEDLPGVRGWSRFLRDDWSEPVGARVVVVGGGNSAVDAACLARRRGAADVTILYRREERDMPAFADGVRQAREEGVSFRFLAAPTVVLGEGRASGLRCVAMRPGDPDESGRARPVPIPGSEFDLPCDTVVAAIGQLPDAGIAAANPGLRTDRAGRIEIDAKGRTSLGRVWAAGDIASGAGTVVGAVRSGRDVARALAATLVESASPAGSLTGT